jgi:hypothetical protein
VFNEDLFHPPGIEPERMIDSWSEIVVSVAAVKALALHAATLKS